MVRLTVAMLVPSSKTCSVADAFRMLMRATRLEPGCTECQIWTSTDDDNPLRMQVHYEERWATETDMEQRVRSSGFTKVLEVLEAASETPQVEFDFVSRHQGLEYVEAVRGETR